MEPPAKLFWPSYFDHISWTVGESRAWLLTRFWVRDTRSFAIPAGPLRIFTPLSIVLGLAIAAISSFVVVALLAYESIRWIVGLLLVRRHDKQQS